MRTISTLQLRLAQRRHRDRRSLPRQAILPLAWACGIGTLALRALPGTAPPPRPVDPGHRQATAVTATLAPTAAHDGTGHDRIGHDDVGTFGPATIFTQGADTFIDPSVDPLMPIAPTEPWSLADGLRFPIAGSAQLTKSFGDPRGRSRSHQGVDIMADKLTPVVAVAPGVVDWLRRDRAQGGMVVGVRHADGWRSRYMHLNNDTPGTDDGNGEGIAEGIEVGVAVAAGQLLGWVGDSGNAEKTSPHLHFELLGPDGPIDPYAALASGQQALDAAAAEAEAVETAG